MCLPHQIWGQSRSKRGELDSCGNDPFEDRERSRIIMRGNGDTDIHGHELIRTRRTERLGLPVPSEEMREMKGEKVGSRFDPRSEEHTSELQSQMRISYAVFCLKKQTQR